MVLDPSANFVQQSLGSSVGTNDPETIDVSDASAFPDPANGEYNLVLWDTTAGRPDQDSNAEIVRVTGRDTGADTLTVARAQEGTSNEKHPNTSAVQLAHTAKLRDDTDSAVGSVGSFSGTPPTIDEIDVPAVQADKQNNTHIPDVGELQTVLSNDATAGDLVKLRSGKEYDPGSETTIPQDVTLKGNGATFAPTTDYDVLFLDSGATAREIVIDFNGVTSPTSRGIRIASGEATADYQTQHKTGVTVEAAVVGKNASETAVELKDDGTGIIGGYWDVKTIECSIGVRGNVTGGGFINGVRFDVEISDCGKGIVHDGSGSTPVFRSLFYGYIEPYSSATHGIENTTSAKSITFWGHIWDAPTYTTNSIAGPNISIFDPVDGAGTIAHADGSSNQISTSLIDGYLEIVTSDTDGLKIQESTSGNDRSGVMTVQELAGVSAFKFIPGGLNSGFISENLWTPLGNPIRGDTGSSPQLLNLRDGIKLDIGLATDPTTSELASNNDVALYVSDGGGDTTGSAGDLVYAVNDSGTIKTTIIAQKSNAT